MSGIPFYATKILAIVIISLLYFIIIAVFGFALNKLMPDDPNEDVTTSSAYIMLYVALFSIAFYAARTQLKYSVDWLNGVQGFDASRLKESGGGVLAAFLGVSLSTGLIGRTTRVRDYVEAKFK
jgi:hypothetical protein